MAYFLPVSHGATFLSTSAGASAIWAPHGGRLRLKGSPFASLGQLFSHSAAAQLYPKQF